MFGDECSVWQQNASRDKGRGIFAVEGLKCLFSSTVNMCHTGELTEMLLGGNLCVVLWSKAVTVDLLTSSFSSLHCLYKIVMRHLN